MICTPCRRAGEYNRNLNGPGTRKLASDRMLQAQANYHHRRCEAPETCPCQHVVGQVTGTEARLAG